MSELRPVFANSFTLFQIPRNLTAVLAQIHQNSPAHVSVSEQTFTEHLLCL